MKIFINDKPLDILPSEELPEDKTFESVFENLEDLPSAKELVDDVLMVEPSKDVVIKLLYLMRTRKMKNLDSITLLVKNKEEMKSFIKSRFFVIKAAGGVVTKGDKVLFIFRMGKWDLPKGKFDKGETPQQCAVREVEEECGIKVKLGKEICKTWHTYTQDRKSILKKTYWYTMENVNDLAMKPQKEEGIDDIRWLSHHDAITALVNSYPSMRYLYKKFLKIVPKIHSS